MSGVPQGYRRAWQTWDLVQVRRVTSLETEPVQATSHDVHLRHRVQKARIERRMSMADLAAHVGVDADRLAAFERGDELLPSDVEARVRSKLGVDGAR